MKKEETNNEATRKIDVFYKYMETKDGKRFKKWLTATKDGKIYAVRFTSLALEKVPQARSTIYVMDSNMFWSKKNPQYPVLYIEKIEKIEAKESAPEDFDIYFEKA